MLPLISQNSGKNIQWFRWPQSFKSKVSGAALPPMRPGFGQSPLHVMQDGQRYYVGTSWVLDDGSERPYTVESDYYDDRQQAELMYKKMTGKDAEGRLRESLQVNLLYLAESSSNEIRIFDLRDAIVNFLESRGIFRWGKTPVSTVIKIENFAEQLVTQCDESNEVTRMARELGFGKPY